VGDAPQPMLRIDHERGPDAHVVRLIGEMDLGNVDRARQALLDAIDGGVAEIVVDLSELDFIDSIGISMLLEAQAASRRDSCRLRFRAPQAEVARVMQVTGVDQQLDLTD
jgi:anti-sigma B factor antagonist